LVLLLDQAQLALKDLLVPRDPWDSRVFLDPKALRVL
jgi:hypothetical protein